RQGFVDNGKGLEPEEVKLDQADSFNPGHVELSERFQEGAAKNKVDPKKAVYIFELMEKFAEYGFNKSHSAAYAMVSYQTAYLKVHYPEEFMAAQLTCESGNTDKVTLYISECRDRSIEILPPHVNQSFRDFRVVDGKIIFGLSAVKNVGEGAIESIIETREDKGPFCNIQDFTRRVDLRKANKKVLESLIKCGAFDGMGHNRHSVVESLDKILESAQSYKKDQDLGQFNLFGDECAALPDDNGDGLIADISEWDELKKLAFERDILGFYITGHPLTKHKELVKRHANTTSATLSDKPSSSEVRIAGMVKQTKEINTKKGDRMAFLTLEDLDGTVEVTLFSDLYARSRHLLDSGDPILVAGLRKGDKANPKVTAQEMYRLEEAPNHLRNGIHLRLSSPGMDPAQITDMKRVLLRHQGKLPVKLHVVIPNRSETTITLPSVKCEPSKELLSEMEEAFGYQPISFE
ncbi:OB-fold nucleic acid binding domain-containing protein, partial [Thermodesulfobacteriota bacterium]